MLFSQCNTLMHHIIFYVVMLTTSLLRKGLLLSLQVGPKVGNDLPQTSQ